MGYPGRHHPFRTMGVSLKTNQRFWGPTPIFRAGNPQVVTTGSPIGGSHQGQVFQALKKIPQYGSSIFIYLHLFSDLFRSILGIWIFGASSSSPLQQSHGFPKGSWGRQVRSKGQEFFYQFWTAELKNGSLDGARLAWLEVSRSQKKSMDAL